MKNISVAELRTLRSAYQPKTDAEIARIQLLDLTDEKRAKRIARIQANAQAIVKFDEAMTKLAAGPLAPDTHGGEFDKVALWNGALLLISGAPDSYRLEVPQYGGVAYIQL